MPSSPTTKAPAAVFVCASGGMARSACTGLPFYKAHEGNQYCVLHYPGKDKSIVFRKTLERKLEVEDFNFCGVWFPDAVDFNDLTFTKPVDFTFATFSAEATFKATFDKEAYFSSAKFGAETSFSRATFRAMASFYGATFSANAAFVYTIFDARAEFASSIFKKASFFYTTFGAEVNFEYAKFDADVSFLYANFKDYLRFAEGSNKAFGDNSSLSFRFARIEKPERVSFHTLTLRPHWFINVDARKFEFTNVNWNWRDISMKQEIISIDEGQGLPAHRLLAIACRNLAVNAEENHCYEEASRFRYMAMEARRLENLFGFAPWTISWWYWLASGYGERVWRAFVVLIGVWLLAAALYTQVGFVRWEPRVASEREAAEARRDEVGEPLRLQRALTYSLGVMTLQKPEPRPATNAAQALVMAETIFGPVQAALLALAIRRKFMR